MPSAISVRPPLLKKKQSFSGSGLPTLADLAPKKVDVDAAYIKATQPRGELDLLNLESLINLDDVNKKGGRGGGGKANANSLSISGMTLQGGPELGVDYKVIQMVIEMIC